MLKVFLLVLALVAITISSGETAVRYVVTGLGSLPNFPWSIATDINSFGQVVGYCQNAQGSTCGFLWENGKMSKLADGEQYLPAASSINDSGQIVGNTSTQGYLWKDGKLQNLGNLGGSSYAAAINNAGEVVGSSVDSTWSNRAFLWVDNEMSRLQVFTNAHFSVAEDINNIGVVVGRSAIDAVGYPYHAFLLQNNQAIDLGTLGNNSEATAINDCTQVVGYSHLSVPTGGVWHAFLWENNHMLDLGTLGGSKSYAADINNMGQIVGYAEDSSDVTQAVLWQDGSIYKLNDLIGQDSGWNLVNACAISNSGQVVGYGTYNGVKQAYVLTPVPEPSSILFLLCGTGGLGGLVWRKRSS